MKIIFVAVFSEKSTNVSQSRCLRRNGVTVVEYDYRARGAVLGQLKRDQELVALCKAEMPDAVLFSKCNHPDVKGINHIPLETYKACRVGNAKLVMWYMDPMYNYDNELRRKIAASDLVFCALELPYRDACTINRKTHFLQEGFDPDVDYPVEDVLPIYDATFIGDLHGERLAYYNAVRFTNITNAYGHQHAVAVCQSKINLNFTEAAAGTSDRTYKVLAAGGFMLTQPWENMSRDFSPGVDFIVFDNIPKLRELITFYLQQPALRNRIAMNGCAKVQRFSRMFWAKYIVDIINL